MKNILDNEITPKEQKIFLVTGKGSYNRSGAKTILDEYLRHFQVIHFFDFDNNPKLEDVLKGVKLFKEHDCNLIIAIGGGSVIDIAKLVNLFSNFAFEDYECLVRNIATQNIKLTPFVAIPTTAGSGSEATHFAVLYINGEKYSIANEMLKPDICIFEPFFLMSQTKYQIAASGIDAFCQAIESHWSLNSTLESREYSKTALNILWNNLVVSIQSKSLEKFKNLLLGAHYAGQAIDIAKTTVCHAVSYGITTKYKISHGHAVALSLPFFTKIHNEALKIDSSNVGLNVALSDISGIIGVSNDLLPRILEDFINSCGLNTCLSLGIRSQMKKDIPVLIKNVNIDRLKNNPVNIDAEMLNSYFTYLVNKNECI